MNRLGFYDNGREFCFFLSFFLLCIARHIKQWLFSFLLELFLSFCFFALRLFFCVQVGATKKNDGKSPVIVTTLVRHAHMQKGKKKGMEKVPGGR
jgi:hypothetical protein